MFDVTDGHEVVGRKQVDKLMENIPNKIVNFMGIVADVNLHEQNGQLCLNAALTPLNRFFS